MQFTAENLHNLKISLYHVVEGSKVNYSIVNNSLVLYYPCLEYDKCTEYQLYLPPGVYKLEAYGASGGYHQSCLPTSKKTSKSTCVSDEYVSYFHGNAKCVTGCSASGSGGYTSGIISLEKRTKIYIAIGGMGKYMAMNCNEENTTYPHCIFPGGYNGGGGAHLYLSDITRTGSASGGGATDFRFESNSLFHRVLVAGAGGGTDNYLENDGFGGSGGGLTAQSFWINNILDTLTASQKSGFSFGYGETASLSGSKNDNGVKNGPQYPNDMAGAGGGWFGGFASHHNSGGGGGGSSFILTKEAEFPSNEIFVYNSTYDLIDSGYYAFRDKSKYIFIEPSFGEGVLYGNGKAIITPLNISNIPNYQFSCIFRLKISISTVIYSFVYI